MVLLWTCLFAALGGFLFGYDLGLIGSALLQIRRYFHVRSSGTVELIVGVAKLGAAVGTFLGGAAMARYGRQRALALNSVAFTAGPLIMAIASGPWMLVLGRFVVGLGVGISATVSPAYIAELAPARIRGMLVQLYEVMLCIGMLLAPLVDWALSRDDSTASWRVMVGLPALPGLLLAAAPLVLPESPRWLVTRNRLDEALQVLTLVTRRSGGLSLGLEGFWSGDYARMPDRDDQSVRDAEDELLQLWSGVQIDRNVVLEQRRKLWRLRQQRNGGRWGRLGCWMGHQGRPKPPSLEPIPEESSGSLLSSPSCLSTASSLAVITTAPAASSPRAPLGGREEQLRQVMLTSQCAAAAVGLVSSPGSPLRNQQQPAVGVGAGVGPGGAEGDSIGHGPASGGRTGGARGRLLSALSRRREGGGVWADDGAYRLLPSEEADAGRGDGGPGPDCRAESERSPPQHRPDERERLLLPGKAGSHGETVSEPGEAAGPSAPPASLADMPGEERSFLRTLTALLADISALAVGPERRALWLALGLAFFDQVTAATAIINYAPTLLKRIGGEDSSFEDGSAMLYTVLIGITKAVGVIAALLLVDCCGRRWLLVTGSLACSLALGGLTVAALAGSVDLLEVAMCTFTLFFSLSWAGVYWVVISELFSMSAKSAATSAAMCLLFLTGALTDMVFLSLHDVMGSYAFLLFAALCLASAAYVWLLLPETKGRTLAEVQALMVRDTGGGAAVAGGGGSSSSRWVQLWERRAELL
ncbi:hypothetical protein VaNZ11_009573 [Volvox africanus]|uniref:Major facilitator superfamily (MFS) profile domain-containing protein n=1 Tax=Volvox africanus TaxID=51714 RepID=A0ABQ5S7N5_9CHLO|nr:hypothetical protein VaNZ11_009573 [Volvox africanus]